MIDTVSSLIYVRGRILMLKRPDDASSFPGVWSLAAGKVEPNESAEDAAVREIKEETGLIVSSPDGSLDPIFVRENDVIWRVRPFIFIHDSDDVTLNEENLEHRWVLPDEVEKMNTVSSTAPAVKELLSKIRRP
ncbi:MAG: NUDIX domain-containing protein [Methanomassiliicoccaceae archaeon]|nr:NUDIX domain-containing protein [Methanomassiliicoccaceae archaeon]